MEAKVREFDFPFTASPPWTDRKVHLCGMSAVGAKAVALLGLDGKPSGLFQFPSIPGMPPNPIFKAEDC
jgi:hypothetical protein